MFIYKNYDTRMPTARGMSESQGDDEIEIGRRQFMSQATIVMSGLMGLGLAIPMVASLIPDVGGQGARWTPLDENGFRELQAATDKAVKIHFTLKTKDAYLPEQPFGEYVWGVKVNDANKFIAARPDLYAPTGKDKLPYQIITMSFVMFSPICPHLGCRYDYDPNSNTFPCPCHGSVYDHDGRVLSGPAARGLDPMPLREHGGEAQVEWIRYRPTIPDRLVLSYLN